MEKGTILYIGNFELPDKGASANRVMTNRKLFEALECRVAYLGVTREDAFEGVRGVSYDGDIFERAYPSSVKMWLERCYSIKDIVETAAKYDDLTALMFYNTPYSLVRAAWRYYRKLGIKILYDCTISCNDGFSFLISVNNGNLTTNTGSIYTIEFDIFC